jgi:hypothetical protein
MHNLLLLQVLFCDRLSIYCTGPSLRSHSATLTLVVTYHGCRRRDSPLIIRTVPSTQQQEVTVSVCTVLYLVLCTEYLCTYVPTYVFCRQYPPEVLLLLPTVPREYLSQQPACRLRLNLQGMLRMVYPRLSSGQARPRRGRSTMTSFLSWRHVHMFSIPGMLCSCLAGRAILSVAP